MAAEAEPSPHRYLTLACTAALSLSPASLKKMTRIFYMTMLVFNDLRIFLLNIAFFFFRYGIPISGFFRSSVNVPSFISHKSEMYYGKEVLSCLSLLANSPNMQIMVAVGFATMLIGKNTSNHLDSRSRCHRTIVFMV